MTKTEELKNKWTPTLLMFRQGQASLEGALQMLAQESKEAGLKFVEVDESFMEEVWQCVTRTEEIEC